jgi:hypothetical protein
VELGFDLGESQLGVLLSERGWLHPCNFPACVTGFLHLVQLFLSLTELFLAFCDFFASVMLI